ncbi:MAG: succinylglutamate desuccinylase/aspartoacylase family protein [Methylobacteriaceae bacterium]|jgi:hypothetical protein|nr:succinylglutamate desuccinylase/aspartoacylase family protein [Methylobacteriaceae bacterium]
MKIKPTSLLACVVSGLLVLTAVLSYNNFTRQWKDDLIIPSKHVTTVKWLSDYLPWLKGTRGDSRVFIIDSGVPGGTFGLLGGTHPDEQAGWMAAIILVEKLQLKSGKMVIIPHANNSAMTHSFPQEATPQFIHIPTDDGAVRVFRGGSRGTNPVDYWPDPEVFSHYQTGQKLSGEEVRNLNRNYPGRPDGQFTERVAHAIFKVLIDEGVDINLDLHEAWPEYPFVNAVGADQRASDIASLAALDLRMEGVEIGVEAVPKKFRGLSYRELSEYSNAMGLLAETPNASQGRIRGITDETLVIKGQDEFYVTATQLGRTFAKFDEHGWPLSKRVARHIALINALARTYTETYPEKPIEFENMPTYDELVDTPVGHFLNSPAAVAGN